MRTLLKSVAIAYLLAPVAAFPASSEAALYVQVRTTALRSEPTFWSPQKTTLNYGSKVSPLSAAATDKSWLKVKSGSDEGYVHVSAVTKRRIVLSGQPAPTGNVDQGSIVLAGKGFNNQVESKYRAANGLDYGAVDEVEKLGVDGAEEATFIKEGKLNS